MHVVLYQFILKIFTPSSVQVDGVSDRDHNTYTASCEDGDHPASQLGSCLATHSPPTALIFLRAVIGCLSEGFAAVGPIPQAKSHEIVLSSGTTTLLNLACIAVPTTIISTFHTEWSISALTA